MSEPLLGEIRLFGFSFAPRGWSKCEGQLLPIAQNSALFSLLGTIYGGNGRTDFALPDLRGRGPIGMGNGPGLPSYGIGQHNGNYQHALTVGQLPAHSHARAINKATGDASTPGGNYLSKSNDGENNFHSAAGTGANAGVLGGAGSVGANQSFNIMNPYLVMNYCIALVGTYPSRD